MKHLLIVSHGSRRAGSNEEVNQIARLVANKPENPFDQVSSAFLEIAKPSIPEGINECIAKGATHITILPYFLAAGRHVVEDIPSEVQMVEYDPEKITIVIKSHIGAANSMSQTILDLSV